MSQYINEAFKQFRLLESEEFDLSPTGLDTLDTFMNQAMTDEDIDIIDLEAEAEEDLKKSYIGKVICDCNVCHSNIFYNKEDIEIDEDGVVNPEDECPYCMSLDGYTIVGEIKPYEEGVTEEEHEDDVDLDVDLDDNEEAEEPIEIESEEDEEEDDDDLDESLTEAFSKGQDVYIKPNKRFGKIKSHIKNDLYEVETYDGEDKNLPDRVDTYYASDLELKESLPLSGVAKLKGKKTLRRRDEYDGCKCILGRNNTELSGDKDLHESIDESLDNDLIKGKTYTCVDEEDGKYKYIGKVEHPEFGELFKFKPLDNAAKEITQEMSDEMGLTYDGFAYMDEETVFYTFLDSEDDLDESLDNDLMTPEEARKYWDSEKDNDPVLAEFDNFQDWYDESVKNGYIKESITESTEKFEIAPAGQGKWKVLKNSVGGGRVSEDSRIVIDADTKEEAREILLANGFKAEELLESIENVSIDTEDETMTMTTKEDGGVVIETSPKEEFEETFGEEEPTELENGDEMIAPLDPETEDELGITDEPEEDMGFDFGEETPESPEEDVDIDEFDEETFDGLGESYLRRCYENVNSFKTTDVICNENLLTVEGNIGFKSGNVKKTSFIFEAKESNNGKYVFEGYNNEINIGKKAFRLNCSIDNKKIIPESLSYNYRSKNDLNESVKLHGTVKAPKRG